MKSYKIAIVLTAATFVSGCTTMKTWFSNKDPEQVRLEQINDRKELNLPEGYSNPKRSEQFEIFPVPASDQDYTPNSPTMVLVIFAKSWLNENDPHPAKIMLERPELVQDLPAFVNDGLQSYLKFNNLKAEKLNDTTYRISRELEVETGFWFWKSMEKSEQYQYDLSIEFQTHQRSGEVYVDMVNYQKVDEELAPEVSDKIRSASLAKQTLNDFMLELDYLYRVQLKKEKSSLDVTLELTKDVTGDIVISSQQEIKYVWEQLEDIIDWLGFSINEEDEDLYTFDVFYEQNEQSIWDAMFNSDVANKLELPKGDYKFEINTTVSGVHIKVKAADGTPLTDNQMSELYELMLQIVKDEELEL